MTKVTTYAEGNFKVGFGGKVYLARDEQGWISARLNGQHSPYRNGSYTLVETIPLGFRPKLTATISATVLKNGRPVPGASVKLTFEANGQIRASVSGMSDSLGQIELSGSMRYQMNPNGYRH